MTVCPSTAAPRFDAEPLPAVAHCNNESGPHSDETRGDRWCEPRGQERLVGGAISFLVHLILILLLGFCFSVSWDDRQGSPELIVEIRETVHELSESGDALLATATGGESVRSITQGIPVRVKVQAASQVQWQETPQ